MIKKTIVLLVCLIFISSAISISIGKTIEKQAQPNENVKVEKITLFRHGIDGSVTPIEVEIEVKEGQDLSKVIIEKCKELFEKDSKLNDFLEDLNSEKTQDDLTTKWGWLFVNSRGKGTHIKTKFIYRFLILLYLFKLRFPRLALKVKREIFCNYENDPNAETTIIPIVKYLTGIEQKQIITGNHSVFVHQFSGFTTWSGRFSITPEDKFSRAFFGFARFVLVKQLL